MIAWGVWLAPCGVQAEELDAIDMARERVERARQTSMPPWHGWRVVSGAARGVQLRQGAWLIEARRVKVTAEVMRVDGEVLLSGPDYSVRAEALTLTPDEVSAQQIRITRRDGESMRAARIIVRLPEGQAEVFGVQVGQKKVSTKSKEQEVR